MTVPAWQSGVAYTPGVVVTHNGEVYKKLRDDDQSEPDLIGGGWELVENSNVADYEAVASAFNAYESKKAAHKQKVAKMIRDAGLTPGDVLVTLTAEAMAGEITR
jgi:hypothetical protein